MDLGRVVVFENLDASKLQDSFAEVFRFFRETYDSIGKTDDDYKTRARKAVNGTADCGRGGADDAVRLAGAERSEHVQRRRAEAVQLADARGEAPPRVEASLPYSPALSLRVNQLASKTTLSTYTTVAAATRFVADRDRDARTISAKAPF